MFQWHLVPAEYAAARRGSPGATFAGNQLPLK